MPSVRQALTAIGSLAFVTLAFLGWWAVELSSTTKDSQKDYVAVSDKVDEAEAHVRKLKDSLAELDQESEQLQRGKEKKGERLGGDADRVQDLEGTVAALRDRMPAVRQVLAWLSFSLTTIGDDRLEAEKTALGSDLDPSRIALSDVTQKDEVLAITGEALFAEDVGRFVKRLEAAGYLSDITLVSTTQHSDKARNKLYQVFKLSAQLEYPKVPDLEDGP